MLALPPTATPAVAQEGIPVTSDLVIATCGGCHRPDEQKRLSRISYRRTTPENWERTIKRMISLNKLALEPADARAILKYLSDAHGLAPEEARAVTFESERRMVDFTYPGDGETAVVCASCHSIGRPMSERRTKEEWGLLLAMHRGYYPGVDNQPMNNGQGFRRTRSVPNEPGPDGRPPDKSQPMDRIIDHLSGAFPLTSAAWTEWTVARQPAALAGTWALTGYVPGKGPIAGTVTIAADPQAPDSFTTDARYRFTKTGEAEHRQGRAVVYTGFQWRGRSSVTGTRASDPWREVMLVDRTQSQMAGRWFGGAYDELGMDVKLVRAGTAPIILGTSAASLKTGSVTSDLKVYALNLPSDVTANQISFGQGVTVTQATSSPEGLTLSVAVAPNAGSGPRDVTVAGAHHPAALMVYDVVHSVRVTPQAGLARVGGAVFPKGYQQFEAIAFHNGPDGKPGTADDWNLGGVAARWSLEEYAATFDDDDIQFVGAIDDRGLFTPNLDGPNPKRTFGGPNIAGRNNIGDVWVVANVASDPARGIPVTKARAQLVVAPPVYVNWMASETGK